MTQDRGGRDVTFPDGSEGGMWIEPTAYTVTVHCPTVKAMEATSEAVLGARWPTSARAEQLLLRLRVPGELWPKMFYQCENHHQWVLSTVEPMPLKMPCPFCGVISPRHFQER
jgi:hypothetical protein